MDNDKTQTRPPEYGGATGSTLFDASKRDIAKCIAKYTPLLAEQVLFVINNAGSVDLAIAAINYGLARNIDPNKVLRAMRA